MNNILSIMLVEKGTLPRPQAVNLMQHYWAVKPTSPLSEETPDGGSTYPGCPSGDNTIQTLQAHHSTPCPRLAESLHPIYYEQATAGNSSSRFLFAR
jgi:hypothetical protein